MRGIGIGLVTRERAFHLFENQHLSGLQSCEGALKRRLRRANREAAPALFPTVEIHLVLLDEEDMERLAPNLGPLKIYTDETGINVFLEIDKPPV